MPEKILCFCCGPKTNNHGVAMLKWQRAEGARYADPSHGINEVGYGADVYVCKSCMEHGCAYPNHPRCAPGLEVEKEEEELRKKEESDRAALEERAALEIAERDARREDALARLAPHRPPAAKREKPPEKKAPKEKPPEKKAPKEKPPEKKAPKEKPRPAGKDGATAPTPAA